MEDAQRILAIETSGRHGSVAALWGEAGGCRLVEQIALGGDQRTAQAMAPALQRLLKKADWLPATIDLVAVAVGPGSFTGLRIGVTTAKAFAYAARTQLVGVNTLEVIAVQAPVSATPLWTILDAQRQELFAASFAVDDAGQLQATRDSFIVTQDAWLAELRPGDRVTGPALARLAPQLPHGIHVVPPDHWQPMATAVGQVAWTSYQTGRRDDIWQLVPKYYRASAAEEKLAQTGR